MKILFYEKKGCQGNHKQKRILKGAKVNFDTASILDTKWSEEMLDSFFKYLEVEKMFNPFAPQIKNGEIDIKNLSRKEAYSLMIKEPILIKRPLIEIDDKKVVGFDTKLLSQLLNINLFTPQKIEICHSGTSCKSV